MSDAVALQASLAFEIQRWLPAKSPLQADLDAGAVIAAIELPTPGVIPVIHHPLVKWVADSFIVHWPAASAALSAAGVFEPPGPPAPGVDPDIVWATGSSEYMLSDGALNSTDAHHLMHAQYRGVGVPTFDTLPISYLPDHEDVYHPMVAGGPPWKGARVVENPPGVFEYYSNIAPGVMTPIDPLPSLYGAPRQLNRNPRAYKLANWDTQGVGGIDQDNIVGINGKLGFASRVTDADPSGYYACTLNIPVNPSPQITSRWIIAKLATQTAWIGLGNGNLGGFPATYISFNQVTGAYNLIAGVFTEIIVDGSHPDFWFITLEQANTGTEYQQKVWAALSLDGLVLDGTAQGFVDVAYASCTEESTAAQVKESAPILTNITAEAQPACTPAYDVLNHDNVQGAYYAEWTPLVASLDVAAPAFIIDTSGGLATSIYGINSADRAARTYDDVTTTELVQAFAADSTNKIATVYDAALSNKAVNFNGVYSVDGAYDGTYATSTNLKLLEGIVAPMLIRNVRLYNLPYADAKSKIDGLMGLAGIVTPDLILEVGRDGANFGFSLGDYGAITPSILNDGNTIVRVRVKLNGQCQFRVQGLYPADEFASMLFVGAGSILNTVDATHTQPGGTTTMWQWDGTDVSLNEGDTIAVNFA